MHSEKSKYVPVACDFVDWIEHLATLRQRVSIVYIDNLKVQYQKDVLIKTWENRGEDGEFLILAEDKGEIRLDAIGKLEGKGPGDYCGI